MDIATIFSSAKTTLDILSGMETNSVLAERVALLKDQIEILRYTYESTQKELTETKAKCTALENEIASYRTAEQFIFEHGAAFKKTSTGYIKAVYCPNCFKVASASFVRFPFQCGSCKWSSMFKMGEFERIFNSLP
ncbi:hypothetical protein B0186_04055 [Canicola haemoglobinophilus]|uniref:Uncharacterized protein n=2 Tax=Pasteurellaceae TaxID=712 RepID=A0A1V4B214_9PAST|nr:hypothetical protein [Canicola haemoglobinophilus]OOS01260.1 hypothetical protein B0186_04055 [Canicola haemoglobinophilus]STO54426.1 Uncharacterised protein [Canicola haemoglobinophilus]STO60100.1 Uncharacterised protein [Canicola haemoglobinophilus]STO68960.1 Uncharacterised protein [Canicola haemoglobinophilus]